MIRITMIALVMATGIANAETNPRTDLPWNLYEKWDRRSPKIQPPSPPDPPSVRTWIDRDGVHQPFYERGYWRERGVDPYRRKAPASPGP